MIVILEVISVSMLLLQSYIKIFGYGFGHSEIFSYRTNSVLHDLFCTINRLEHN